MNPSARYSAGFLPPGHPAQEKAGWASATEAVNGASPDGNELDEQVKVSEGDLNHQLFIFIHFFLS